MTQREGLVSGGATEQGPASAQQMAARPHRLQQFLQTAPGVHPEFLALAQRHGVLTEDPPATNGHSSHASIDLQSLHDILAGQFQKLNPVVPADIDLCDTGLDEAQRDAVTRAVSTPDVFLLQGLPGTGKSRVVAEVVMQAAMRGERILLLAPRAAAIDRILDLVGNREAISAIRCVGADERAEALPSASRALTFAERVRQLGTQPVELARQDVADLEAKRQNHQQHLARLEQLKELARRLRDIEQAEQARRQQVAAQVEADSAAGGAAFAADLARLDAAHREVLSQLDSQLHEVRRRADEVKAEEARLQARLGDLSILLDSKRNGRWWTPAWWRALWQRDLAGQLADLDAKLQQARAEGGSLASQIDTLTTQPKQAQDDHERKRSGRIGVEIAERLSQPNEASRLRNEEKQALADQWQAVCVQIEASNPRPESCTEAAVEQTEAACRQQLQADEERLASARQWLTCVEEFARTLEPRLVRHANLVAATTHALPADKHFGHQADHCNRFDIMILQNAEQVTQSELLSLAKHARRWLLIAETRSPAAEDKSRPALQLQCFASLWDRLHCDPRGRSSDWIQEKYRLLCKLRPVSAQQRQWLECERVADFPDIELRILTLPRSAPVLAEVVFPSSLSISQAKSYLFKELQELPICPVSSQLLWSDESDRCVLHLGTASAETMRVCLDPGVHEVIFRTETGSNGAQTTLWTTARIEFDHKAGWDRRKAGEWVERHLGLRDLERTARLDTPHRMHADLARFVADLLFPGQYRIHHDHGHAGSNGTLTHVEFVAVGGPSKQNGKHQNGKKSNHRAALPKPAHRTGAGLELDLTVERRQSDRLPAELRALLPNQGVVNYFEAQAIVRAIEDMLADASAWQRLAADGGLAIVALYSAQATLIRELLQRSATLRSAGFMPTVAVPAALQEREFGQVFVSLTRSHAHRAVTFGEGPDLLALALTRARSRLVLFGDPGTLARRCEWTEAVDHLDESAASRERDIISRLVTYLDGQGGQQKTFLLRTSAR